MPRELYVVTMDPGYRSELKHRREDWFTVAVNKHVASAGMGRDAIVVQRDLSGDDGTIDWIGYARRNGNVSTHQTRVKVSMRFELARRVRVSSLSSLMSRQHFQSLLEAVRSRGGELTAKVKEDLKAALRDHVPEDVWENLSDDGQVGCATKQTVVLQRDALVTGLTIAGIDASKASSLSIDEPVSVLAQLRPKATEAAVLDNDARHFPMRKHKSKHIHVHHFVQGDTQLEVTNLNVTKQEEALGVDLLYYNHKYDSYTGVQYKVVESETMLYLNDRVENQIDRMCQFEDLSVDMAGFRNCRFGRAPSAFFKFARTDGRQLSTGMVSGQYVPVKLARALIDEGAAVGERGGKALTYKNMDGRWVNNDDFCRLVKNGLIGTAGVNVENLSEYVDQSLVNKRSVMLIASAEVPQRLRAGIGL